MSGVLSGLFDGMDRNLEAALARLMDRTHRDTLVARMDLESILTGPPETEVTLAPNWAEIEATLRHISSRYPAAVLKLHLHVGNDEATGVHLRVIGCRGGWAIGWIESSEYLAARFAASACAPEEWVSWQGPWDVIDLRGWQVCRDTDLAFRVVRHFALSGERFADVAWEAE